MIVELFSDLDLLSIYVYVSLTTICWYTIIAGGLYLFLHPLQQGNKLDDSGTSYDQEPKYKDIKTQPTKPKLSTAVSEYYDGCCSCLAASVNVTLSIYFALNSINLMSYNLTDLSISYHCFSLFLIWLITEVFEWSFHYLSHNNKYLWAIHKKHHLYPNPTPLTVLSDDPIDMWIKSSPLLWLPFLFPVYDFALFGWFGFINFVYGTYLHCGYEFTFLPSRQSKYFISSWHHNIHHMKNVNANFGFFTRFMDRIAGTTYEPNQSNSEFRKRTRF
jgi:sterol desaturase/sphingolipid hydroxylase (fatty acid hydroxylase superfamily)